MGDYIEREAAYSLAKRICDAIASGRYRPGIFGRDILDWIDDIPAADVRPVVRGKWTRQRITFTSDAEIFLCSACTDISFRASRFCPNCGADMRPPEEAE